MTTVPFEIPARPTSARFWSAYAVTMRPYLLFVSGITGIVGLSLGHAVGIIPLMVLGLAFLLSYGFGQALTDCFQTDTDALSSPYRPLVRGIVVRGDVLIVSLLGLATCGAALAAFNPVNVLLGIAAAAGLVTYTWFKRRWWGGPWYNAWIVALLVAMGYLAVGGPPSWSPALIGSMLVALLAYANFVLAGYFKDIEADRATGYRTAPVVFGRRRTSWASDVLAVGAFLAAIPALTDGFVPLALVFIIPAATWSLLGQWRLHRVHHDTEAHAAIGPVVHTYVFLLAGIAVAHQPAWVIGLIPFIIAYGWTMSRRPMATQI